MMLGVSTRRYARSPEPLPGEFAVHGIGKNAVSECFVVRMQRRLAALMACDLSGLELVALIENLTRSLESAHPSAAASLREGLDETLTVMRLELPEENLERVLSSTNLIENLCSRLREVARRVKRWQGSAMILRWTAARVLEAECHFRKVAGYRAIPKHSRGAARSCNCIDRAHLLENGRRAA